MKDYKNHLDQPIGFPVENWKQPAWPDGRTLTGDTCRLERLDAAHHGNDLHQSNALATDDRQWTYLAYGPFNSPEAYCQWIDENCRQSDPLFYAILENSNGLGVGVASYLRINPVDGVIEVGHINYSSRLQKTPMATEAMFLMMSHAFDDLGYRRYEWKCDALNAPSRQAALRLGFTFEGVFRQATMYKGRNRDTSWFSIIDTEWPRLKSAYLTWLDPDNFEAGRQKRKLNELIRESI